MSEFKNMLLNTALSKGLWETHDNDNNESNSYHLLSTYYVSGT